MKHFAQVPPTAGAPITSDTLSKPTPMWRLVLFAASAGLALATYALWRPPRADVVAQNQRSSGPRYQQSRAHSGRFAASLDHAAFARLAASCRCESHVLQRRRNLKLYPELAHRIATEGHALANHSQPHHNLTTVAPRDLPLHIDAGFATIDRVEKAAGVQAHTTLFRPPGGGLDRDAMAYLYGRDYTLAWWSNNVGDWTCPPAWKIADGVKANLRPGDILLLHDGGTGTPQAIGAIVKDARKRGMEFVLMDEETTGDSSQETVLRK